MLLLGFKLKKVGFRARKVKTMEVLQQKCTNRSQETPNLSSGWKNVQKRRRLTCSLSFTDLRQASLVQHRAKSGQKSQGFTSDSHTFPKDKIQLHLKLVKDICRYCHSCRLKNTMMMKCFLFVIAGKNIRTTNVKRYEVSFETADRIIVTTS